MEKTLKENKLIITILVAAFVVASALFYVGSKMTPGAGSNAQDSSNTLTFAEQLEAYQAEQQLAQEQQQADQAKQAEEQAKNVPDITADDNIKGKKDAKITIFEYSDFECPYCKRFYKTPDQLVKNNPGTVNAVFRHFPLSFHDPIATTEAIASECAADQGKFWEYHAEVFGRTKSNKGLAESELYVIADDLGLNSFTFKNCLENETHLDKVRSDMAGGAASGVTGTPGSIIKNNETGEVRFINGAYPIESVQAAIDELLVK